LTLLAERRVEPWLFTAGTAFVAAACTLLVGLVPAVRFAFFNPTMHVALETVEATIALFLAYLIVGRVRETARITDLGLVCALTVTGLTNLALAGVPRILSGARTPEFAIWAPLFARLIAASLLALSAVPSRRTVRRGQPAVWALAASIGSLVLVGGLVLALSPYLPTGIEIRPPSETFQATQLTRYPAIVAVQLAGMLLLGAASIGFTRRAKATGDRLYRWLGAAAMLAAFARLNYALFPSGYSGFVYVGDFMRLGFYVFLVRGAVLEIRQYWRSRSEAARLQERSRLARHLHNGLAQELVSISGQTNLLRKGRTAPDAANLERLGRATDRAVGEARRAIAALSEPLHQPLDRVIEGFTEELLSVADVTLELDLEAEVYVAPDVTEEILRVLREAITNSIHHAQPEKIRVWLVDRDGIRLGVVDDGRGFDPAEPGNGGGYGLSIMNQKAASIGARLDVRSQRGIGTEVELSLQEPGT
jgi:signal transduction histidine kinase